MTTAPYGRTLLVVKDLKNGPCYKVGTKVFVEALAAPSKVCEWCKITTFACLIKLAIVISWVTENVDLLT